MYQYLLGLHDREMAIYVWEEYQVPISIASLNLMLRFCAFLHDRIYQVGGVIYLICVI